jgi:hypothetical protein
MDQKGNAMLGLILEESTVVGNNTDIGSLCQSIKLLAYSFSLTT